MTVSEYDTMGIYQYGYTALSPFSILYLTDKLACLSMAVGQYISIRQYLWDYGKMATWQYGSMGIYPLAADAYISEASLSRQAVCH